MPLDVLSLSDLMFPQSQGYFWLLDTLRMKEIAHISSFNYIKYILKYNMAQSMELIFL